MRIFKILATLAFIMSLSVPSFAQGSAASASGSLVDAGGEVRVGEVDSGEAGGGEADGDEVSSMVDRAEGAVGGCGGAVLLLLCCSTALDNVAGGMLVSLPCCIISSPKQA